MPLTGDLRRVGLKFQPTPAGEGGRCGRGQASAGAVECFNPRPPVRAGDA